MLSSGAGTHVGPDAGLRHSYLINRRGVLIVGLKVRAPAAAVVGENTEDIR